MQASNHANSTPLLAIASGVFAAIYAMVWEVPVLVLILPLTISTIFAGKYIDYMPNGNVRMLLTVAYVGTLLVMLFDVKYMFLPLRGVDWYGYSARAVELLDTGKYGFSLLFTYSDTQDVFAQCVAVLYSLFGIWHQMIHCYIFASAQIAVYYFTKSAKIIYRDEKYSTLSTILLALAPIFIMHSIAFLREVPIAMLFSISLYCYFKYIKTSGILFLLFAIFYAVVSATIHSVMIVVPVCYLGFLMLYYPGKKKLKISIVNLLLFVILYFVIFATPIGSSMMTKFTGKDVLAMDADVMDATTLYISGTAGSVTAMIAQTPYRFILFELVPLPWMIKNFSTFISWLLDGLLRLFMVYNIFALFFRNKSNLSPEERVVVWLGLLIWLGFGILCAWGVTTYGTAMRHRVKILPIEIILVVFNIMLHRWKTVRTCGSVEEA